MLASTEKTTESIVSMLVHMAPVARARMDELPPQQQKRLIRQASACLGSPSDTVDAVYAFNSACRTFPTKQPNRISALIVVFSDIVSTFGK